MTEYEWVQVREQAISAFGGQAPGAELEDAMLALFARAPARVAAEIPRVAAKLQQGTIRSGWPILRLNVEEALARGADVRATDTAERDVRVAQARQWIQVAGAHFDRESEVADELFGEQGRLQAWVQIEWLLNEGGLRTGEFVLRGDEELGRGLLAVWGKRRPAGERVEREAEEFARKRVELRAALRAAAQEKRAELEREAAPS